MIIIMNNEYPLIPMLYLLFVIFVIVIIIAIDEFNIKKILKFKKLKRRNKLKFSLKTLKKLKIFHTIITDKATYIMYNIEQDEDSHVSLSIERNGIRILENEIKDESFELWVSQYETFVRGCIRELRYYIKKNNEIIIEDYINSND